MASGGRGGRRKPPASKPKTPAAPGGGAPERAPRQSATARRQEAAQARRRREAIRRNAILGVVGLLLAALLTVCLVDRAQDRQAREELISQITAGDCEYDTRTDDGGEHVPNPSYDLDPPSGGDHTPQAASEGIYREGQVPPDGPLVHALEHGFVIIWYQPDDPEVQEQAENLGSDFPDETLVVPRPSLDVPVAATAWHRRLLCDSFERDSLERFITAFRDQGPETGFI